MSDVMIAAIMIVALIKRAGVNTVTLTSEDVRLAYYALDNLQAVNNKDGTMTINVGPKNSEVN